MFKTASRMKDLTIHASDGEIGSVEEFYFDDETWAIRYPIVDTGGWLSRRRVLISPAFLLYADWESRGLHLALTKKQIEKSPDIDTHLPVSRQHEAEYMDHFGASYYWAWVVRYLDVDTRNWLPGKRVLIAPDWIQNVSWLESKVFIDVQRETIKSGPEYIESRPITPEYEHLLHEHYGRRPYWMWETGTIRARRLKETHLV